jgi:hypothetical protein
MSRAEGSGLPSPVPRHSSPVTPEELWQQVLVRLEQEEQGLPLFNRASLRWEGKKAVLLAPRIAVAWALQSQEERIQAHLRHLTGQEVAVQVRAGPGVSCGRV